MFRLRLASFDSRGKLVCSRSTGYQLLTLEKDQVSEQPVDESDVVIVPLPCIICCS